MRDLSNQEKQEHQRLMKQVEKLTGEVTSFTKDKETLSSEVSQLQEQIIELQEQVEMGILIIFINVQTLIYFFKILFINKDLQV